MKEEFYEPIFNTDSKVACFVGAIWNEAGMGNEALIPEIQSALASHGITWEHLTQVPAREMVDAVRRSRIAPAFTGAWQAQRNYLPCRAFKNVAYGALCLCNVPAVKRLFGLPDLEVAEMIHQALDLSRVHYLGLVREQQKVAGRYTYREALEAIDRALEAGR